MLFYHYSAPQYNVVASGAYSITGDVTVTPSIAAVMTYTMNAAFTGDVTVTPAIAATMVYSSGAAYSITGDVSVTPAIAAAMDYTRNASIVGDMTVAPAIAATMNYTMNAAIVGDVTVTPAIAATMDYTRNASIIGDVTVTPTIAATMQYLSGYGIIGDVTVSPVIAAAMDYTRNASITGDITITPSIAAAMDYTQYVVPGTGGPAITTAGQIDVSRQAIDVPLVMSVDSSGGVAGLDVTVEIRDTVNSAAYLDFSDNTFKTSGWVQKALTLNDLTGGFYSNQLNLNAITNMPSSNHLVAEYSVAGSVTGISTSLLSLTQSGNSNIFPMIFNS